MEKLALSINETCEVLGVSRATVNKLIANGELPARKMGRRVLILTADLRSYVESLSAPHDSH